MATPTQQQAYHGAASYTGASSQGATMPPNQYHGTQGQYSSAAAGNEPSFDKYCVIHVATTCDEHGVYVTKDSAEVIEIGWVVVDAKDPNLPEVRSGHSHGPHSDTPGLPRAMRQNFGNFADPACNSCTDNPSSSSP